MAESGIPVNSKLTPKRRNGHKEDSDIAAAVARLIRALGKRAATADPNTGADLKMLEAEIASAWATAIVGWRRSGFTDADIGAALGVSKQAVQQRWPR